MVETETDNTQEVEYTREPMTPEELKKRVDDRITHKLKEGDELEGVYMGAYEVNTQYGLQTQHGFKVEGSDNVIYYWGNLSMDSAITDANLCAMDHVHIRRMQNNVYVVDVLD